MNLVAESVNVLEAHVEEWLYRNPAMFEKGAGDFFRDFEWVGRQLRIPAGIIDLLGCYTNPLGHNGLLVVEVKRGRIEESAITQVCRYAESLDEVIGASLYSTAIERMVVGTEIGNKEFATAMALRVSAMTFEIRLSLENLWNVGWTKEYRDELSKRVQNSANSPAITDVITVLMRRESRQPVEPQA